MKSQFYRFAIVLIALGVILTSSNRVLAVQCDYHKELEKCESEVEKELKQIHISIDEFFKKKALSISVKESLLEFAEADVNWIAYHDTISGGFFSGIEHQQIEAETQSRLFEELKEVMALKSPSKNATENFKQEDEKLNSNYKFCIKSGEDNSGDKPDLASASERAWLRYRDAVLKAIDSKLKDEVAAKLTHFRVLELKPCITLNDWKEHQL